MHRQKSVISGPDLFGSESGSLIIFSEYFISRFFVYVTTLKKKKEKEGIKYLVFKRSL